jgi:hypothetical protein
MFVLSNRLLLLSPHDPRMPLHCAGFENENVSSGMEDGGAGTSELMACKVSIARGRFKGVIIFLESAADDGQASSV